MKKIYIAILSLSLLSACTPVRFSYVGSSSTPTQKVDVFVEENAIKRNYVVVGKGYAQPNWRGEYDQEKILAKAIEKARKNGADAVFFRETWMPASGTTIHTNSRADSSGKSLITQSNSTIGPVSGYFHKEILFLRYN
ncbi:MAG: hypothetical protein NTW29_14870 [Bacteroidetes bacterium]|nr:hypothetical protein [Bacteroidota bacterium]